nr:hypothetical protein BaRGS_008382 [Batillaria attramentaria]
MMVVWQLDFRRYLDRQDNPLDAATTALLSRSATGGTGNREGDFMMLIIHQKYGLIVVRVTMVGFRMVDVQDVKEKLADAVTEATKELNAADCLLKHMTSDLQHVKVTKVVIMPSVTSGQLEYTFGDNPDVQQVKDVHILSTSETSRAMSFKLQHQLQLSMRNLSLGSSGQSPQVYRHHFCFMEDEMDEAIDALVEVARDAGGQLYVLIDEAGPPKLFPKFCQQLVSRVPTVHLWATALEHGLRPACLTEVRLTFPHRCSRAVLQEISASRAFSDGHVYQYDQNVVAAEKDGDKMKYMKHKNQYGHTGHYPLECDETRDEHGNVTSQASGLVRGLRARGIPVQVVRRLDPDDVIRDVALAINNRVTVADYTMVAGLERRVVARFFENTQPNGFKFGMQVDASTI